MDKYMEKWLENCCGENGEAEKEKMREQMEKAGCSCCSPRPGTDIREPDGERCELPGKCC